MAPRAVPKGSGTVDLGGQLLCLYVTLVLYSRCFVFGATSSNSFSADMATHTSLGALIHLSPLLPPSSLLWGCSKGRDVSGTSKKALQHLRDLGVVELGERSGAGKCMHGMLVELIGRFSDVAVGGHVDGDAHERFPGFK